MKAWLKANVQSVVVSMIRVNKENWWIPIVAMPDVLNACLLWSSALCAKFVLDLIQDSNPEPPIISLALVVNLASNPSMAALALFIQPQVIILIGNSDF